jgi:hypothetical protein
MTEKTKDVAHKMPAQEAQGLSKRQHGEKRDDTTSELTRMSSGRALRDLMTSITSVEFFTCRGECATCSPSSFARYWARR